MSVAALTMVFDDDYFLKKWIGYWEQFLPRKQLVVLSHGPQESVYDIAQGCSIVELARRTDDKDLDAHRWGTLTHFARGLLFQYTKVVTSDVDEILVLDPEVGDNIVDHLEKLPNNRVFHVNPMEIVHRSDLEPDLDESAPILKQRQFFQTNKWYAKPSISSSRHLEWKMDGHCTFDDIKFLPEIYMFHLKWVDQKQMLRRAQIRHDLMRDGDGELFVKAGGGWTRTMEQWTEYFEILENKPITDEPCDYDQFRRDILASSYKHEQFGYWVFPRNESKVLYKVPERFSHFF